jgi:aspartyl-tRNA(Asn)/glutamyl-tRNA(Gln) amidotransferase subunit B
VHTPYGTLVNLNRAGVPLIEIVSEADMRNSEEAGQYLRTIHNILRYAEVCDGNMEQGNFRCDANISVMPEGSKTWGTKVELKNINSFKFVEKAIDYEIKRQISLIESGKTIVQETRGWNSAEGVTESMRAKEQAHDYRYFPEPDLPVLIIDSARKERVRSEMPELPAARQARFQSELGLSEYDSAVLTSTQELAHYFESVKAVCNNPKVAANWVMNELLGRLNAAGKEIEASPVSSESMSELVSKIESQEISGKIAKTVFEEMFATGKSPSAIIKEKGLVQISDAGQLESVIKQIIANNPAQLADYKAGKVKLLGFFVGQAMKETKGQANPQVLNDLVKKLLDS